MSAPQVPADLELEEKHSMLHDDDYKSSPLRDTDAEADALMIKDEEGAVRANPAYRSSTILFWIVLNVVSTVSIVFINKSIFAAPSFNNAQFLFGSYHFTLTYLLLSLLSSPSGILVRLKQFDRRSISLRGIMPLAGSMSLSVVFLNTSLAFCTVTFYQTVRVLLTPVVALLDYLFFGKTIPQQAAWMLVPTCAGVAFMAYSETSNAVDPEQSTSLFGAGFALTGVVISSVYTVWIKFYHQKLEANSSQLLHAQSPVGAIMLAVLGVASGKLPRVAEFDTHMWLTLFLSGVCATLLNLSQFRIIALAGPITGTIVGHVKTICIVVIGWSMSAREVNHNSVLGILIAIGGIVAYSVMERRYRAPAQSG